MDGDLAPLEEIVDIAQRSGARTVVDEAHAVGNFGPGGRGAIARAGLEGEIDVAVGTLGKALGSYGAYACTSAEMVRLLVNTSRSLIFSTAPPPPSVAGALAALELLEDRPHRVQRLRTNARALRGALELEGFPVSESDMHIVPLIIGDERDAMRMCQEAIERGVFAQAIRPPTVPAGTARLRLTVMASHTAAELRKAAGVLGSVARRISLDPGAMTPAMCELEPEVFEDGASPIAMPAMPRGLGEDGPVPASGQGPFDFEAEPTTPFDGERGIQVTARPSARARLGMRGLFITGTDTEQARASSRPPWWPPCLRPASAWWRTSRP